MAVLFATLVTMRPWSSDALENGEGGPRGPSGTSPITTPPPGEQRPVELPEFLISYAGARHHLESMDALEEREQVRDWARIGLAAQLELDTEDLLGAAYDTLPVREEGFADLARQPVGLGRSLYADGVLHLLVTHEEADPSWDRTVGLLLDQHRADAGTDPRRVRVHRYTVHRDTEHHDVQFVHVASDDPVDTDEFRDAHGYVRMRIDDPEGLTEFLATTHALSTVEVDGGEVWAGGWRWPEGAGQQLTREDIAVLQRGYDPSTSGPTPGFSLDPVPGDLRLSKARYDGGVGGTDVGMTLFYTDIVAKDWVTGVGDGVPTEAVEGFVPNPEAETAWSHCEPGADLEESGRLWFGQSDGAYSYHDDRIDIGEQPTRLFSRSFGSGGGEVEPSYFFGRALRWWDRHYQEVADYEPQYQRLDQIMRWSAALEWLAGQPAELPPHSEVDVRGDLRFADWYDSNDALRERAPIDWVSAQEESLRTIMSEPFDRCGRTYVTGGVTLSDRVARAREGGHSLQNDLHPSVRRARPLDKSSNYDPATGTGSVREQSLDGINAVSSYRHREFSRTDGGAARVAIEASSRDHIPLGSTKEMHPAGTPRTAALEVRGGGGDVAIRSWHEGQKHVEVTAEVPRQGLVSVDVHHGPGARVKNIAESLRNRIHEGHGNTPVDGVLYSLPDGNGRPLYQIGGTDGPSLMVTDTPVEGAIGPTLRQGVPGDSGPRFQYFTPVQSRAPPAGTYLKVTQGTADAAATATETGPPPSNAQPVRVTTKAGGEGTASSDGNSTWTPGDNPIFGAPEGQAFLAEYQRRIVPAQRLADETGLQVGISFGDRGAAFVGRDGTLLVPAADAWAKAVVRATVARPDALPLFHLFEGRHPVYQAEVPLTKLPGTVERGRLDGFLNNLTEGEAVLFHSSMRATLPDGPLTVDAIPAGVEVTVSRARPANPNVRMDIAAQPDVWVDSGVKWRPISSAFVSVGSVSEDDPEPPPVTVTGPGPSEDLAPPASALVQPTTILLVCSQDDDKDCAA